jgi:molybdopterin synthase catalytic subunit
MKPRISIQREDFSFDTEIETLKHASGNAGAVVTFTGYVRGENGLDTLTLEHYPAMTEQEIARAVAEAETRWPILGATIIHRVGKLIPGERIVLVAVASSHRKTAFEACEFLIDYLKTRAPFWKEEQLGRETRWVEHRHSDAEAAKRWR